MMNGEEVFYIIQCSTGSYNLVLGFMYKFICRLNNSENYIIVALTNIKLALHGMCPSYGSIGIVVSFEVCIILGVLSYLSVFFIWTGKVYYYYYYKCLFI